MRWIPGKERGYEPDQFAYLFGRSGTAGHCRRTGTGAGHTAGSAAGQDPSAALPGSRTQRSPAAGIVYALCMPGGYSVPVQGGRDILGASAVSGQPDQHFPAAEPDQECMGSGQIQTVCPQENQSLGSAAAAFHGEGCAQSDLYVPAFRHGADQRGFTGAGDLSGLSGDVWGIQGEL